MLDEIPVSASCRVVTTGTNNVDATLVDVGRDPGRHAPTSISRVGIDDDEHLLLREELQGLLFGGLFKRQDYRDEFDSLGRWDFG